MVHNLKDGDIICHSNGSYACISRCHVLGFQDGYCILCFDGPTTKYPERCAIFGMECHNDWIMAEPNITGTISITSGTLQINGTDTLFTTDVSIGDKLIVGSKQMIVDSIPDNTTILLTTIYNGETLNNSNMWNLSI